MTILRLFQLQLSRNLPQFITLTLLSGGSSAAVLATINSAAASLHRGGTLRLLLIFVLVIVTYGISQRALMLLAAATAERLVEGLRIEFVGRLEAAELLDIENLNRSEFYNALSSEMQVISDGALGLIIMGQSLVLVIVTMVYVAWLSFAAAIAAVIFMAVAASFHIARNKEIRERMRHISQQQTSLLASFADYVDGFKEVKLNTRRSTELSSHIRASAHELAERQLSTRALFARDLIYSQITFYLLPGVMVFLVPMFSGVDTATVAMTTTSVLFLIGPISTVVGGLPVLQRMSAAADAILSIQRQLSEIGRRPIAPSVNFHT
jgi:putative pyoverdin transport system ATP-binding/permease protein